MDIDPKLVEQVLHLCARHCCVCRRFRPTRIQVHHIVPREEGGTDAPENLMPVCIVCHTDIHSRIPFVRRFTHKELADNRDRVYQMVHDGKLVPPEDENPVFLELREPKTVNAGAVVGLNPVAIRLLAAAAEGDGEVLYYRESGWDWRFGSNGGDRWIESESRAIAAHKDALNALVKRGLFESNSDSRFEITHAGYCEYDDLVAAGSIVPKKPNSI